MDIKADSVKDKKYRHHEKGHPLQDLFAAKRSRKLIGGTNFNSKN